MTVASLPKATIILASLPGVWTRVKEAGEEVLLVVGVSRVHGIDVMEGDVLVVDDDPGVREVVIRALTTTVRGTIVGAASAAAAKACVLERPYDVVVSDINMPDEDGVALLEWARSACPEPSWILLTGHGTLETAVTALKLGAFDFLLKPVNITQLRNAVRNVLEQRRLKKERDRLHGDLEQRNRQLREHVGQLENACRLLTEQAVTIRADLERAAWIQRALLPSEMPKASDVHVHALYRPAQIVGGDLYDIVLVDEEHLAVIIADAAGHGLSAAMLAVMFRNQLPLRTADARRAREPSDAFRRVNNALFRHFRVPGMFVTAAYCLFDLTCNEALVVSAGHAPIILRKSDGTLERVFHTGPALGLYENADFRTTRLTLAPGDQLLLYTDGLYAHGPAGSGSSDGLVRQVQQAPQAHGMALLNTLLAGANGESGTHPVKDVAPVSNADQADDISLVLVTVGAGESQLDNGVPAKLPAMASSPTPPHADLLFGRTEQRAIFALVGSLNWTLAGALYDHCITELEAGFLVMLDCALCLHLDSTVLGTIHELAERADALDIELRVQGVSPVLEQLFEELGMKRVAEHVVPRMLPLPHQMRSIVGERVDVESGSLRVLRAHEGLAQLSSRNREEFSGLLTLLRRQVAGL